MRASSGRVTRVSLMAIPPRLCGREAGNRLIPSRDNRRARQLAGYPDEDRRRRVATPAAIRPSLLVGQHSPPEALGPPDPGAEAFELDDLAMIDEEVHLGAVRLDVPGEHLGIGRIEHQAV